jgi:transcription initiation factor TFIIIB Brf1 subunit/transcription initiation factor TFIIB
MLRGIYLSCTRCQGNDVVVDTSRGDAICRSCGEVNNDRLIDQSFEKRIFKNDGSGVSNARSSGKEDSYGSLQTVFSGGTAEMRASLMKSQLKCEDQQEIKILRNINLVYDYGANLQLPANIMVCEFII